MDKKKVPDEKILTKKSFPQGHWWMLPRSDKVNLNFPI
jgi:hypothetical protein